MHRDAITAAVAARLVAEQFPAWADLPVIPVAESGWDNRTFRLGDGLTVRLPTAEWYVAAVAKEHTWLPRLAPHLPLPIPLPVALGSPGGGYPWPWSVRRWIDGRPAADDRIADPVAFADDLARFLVAPWSVDAAGGPDAGAHSFHRGGALSVYDEETRAASTCSGRGSTGPRRPGCGMRRWRRRGPVRLRGSTATSRWETCWSTQRAGCPP